MKNLLRRLSALCVITVLVAVASGQTNAPTAPAIAAAKSPSPDELSQAELLKSYLQLREQLQATQLAIATSRIEAEVTARAQSAALAERLEAIKTALDVERERRRTESEQAQALRIETERKQAEQQRSNRVILWFALGIGSVALLAIVAGPLLQWRAINHLAKVVATRPQLMAPPQTALLTAETGGGLSDHTVTVSNQRMQGMIERMERRIFELEHTAGGSSPSAMATTSTFISGEGLPRVVAANDHSARIQLLLANGHSMLAAGKAKEAVTCYNEVLKLDLNHAEALVRRGAALEKLKQDDEAIQCYDRAIKADSKMTLAYLYKGGVCNRLERYEEASKCYEQALKTEDESRAAAHVPFTSAAERVSASRL